MKRRNTFYESAGSKVIFANKQIMNKKDCYDVFLSHRYTDADFVITLVDMFNNAGYSVYVDWIEDSQLDRSNVTETTADLLRKRMNASRSLAYVATDNSSYSKWCPWELGYMDGKKNRCCILPILEYAGSDFKGTEYLGLYPYIEYKEQDHDFWIYNQKNQSRYIRLHDWLNGHTF